FGGSHVSLATRRVRARAASLLGERRFATTFTLTASITFAALVAGYAEVRTSGPPSIALADLAWARAILFASAALGIVLMVAALAPTAYWGSPAAILKDGVRPAHG